MALLVYVLCQPVHSCVEPSLHQLDFLLEIFFMETFFFDKNLNNFVTQAAHTLAVDALSLHMCTNWLPTASTLCPLLIVFLQKSSSSTCKSQLRSKQSSNGPSPDNFMTIAWWLFRMLHVLQYGTRLAEEKKKVNNSDSFQPFQVCHFKVAPIHIANTTAGWGKLYKQLCVFFNASICSPAMMLNTLIWSHHLNCFQAIPTYGYATANPYLACSSSFCTTSSCVTGVT